MILAKSEIFKLQNALSKPIPVLTLKKSPGTEDRLPIGYSLPDFQLIWNNLKIAILQLQIALNPYEF